MPVNKFKIVPDGTNKNLNVKLYSEWDLEDRDDAIDEYKNTVVEEVVEAQVVEEVIETPVAEVAVETPAVDEVAAEEKPAEQA